MKTIAQIKILLQQEKQNVSAKKHTKKNLKNIECYSELLKYLETGITESYLLKSREIITKIIKGKEDNFKYWCDHIGYEVEAKKKRSVFNQENNLPYLKKQLKNINFILNN